MLPGRFLIPNMEEIIEDMKYGNYFTTIDLYTNYSQNSLEEEWKEDLRV